jgi:hypothetical protein
VGVGSGWCALTPSGQAASKADFIHHGTPHLFAPSATVGLPPVDAVEALGSIVADEDPKQRLGVTPFFEVRPSLGQQARSHPRTPDAWIDVQGKNLSRPGLVGVSAGARGDEPTDVAVFDGHDGGGHAHFGGTKGVVGRAIIGAQRVKVFVREQSAIRHLPRSDVHSSNGGGVLGPSGAQAQHWGPFDAARTNSDTRAGSTRAPQIPPQSHIDSSVPPQTRTAVWASG